MACSTNNTFRKKEEIFERNNRNKEMQAGLQTNSGLAIRHHLDLHHVQLG